MKPFFPGRVFFAAALCLVLAVPSPVEGKSAPQKLLSPQSASADDQVQKKLDAFARQTISSINRAVLPSASKKEVVQNADGTFTARYIEVDPNTLATSYRQPEDNKAVAYVGYLDYVEVEYVCTARNRADALNGPFTVRRRAPLTELIKYIKGKWTY
ncbi:MAG: hypothetical protein LBP61_04130 [Desulfovibrio sp.]|jgi:hypothetical protein|nr:hypothetical protein [Desulfovibrio sp.]